MPKPPETCGGAGRPSLNISGVYDLSIESLASLIYWKVNVWISECKNGKYWKEQPINSYNRVARKISVDRLHLAFL